MNTVQWRAGIIINGSLADSAEVRNKAAIHLNFLTSTIGSRRLVN